MRYRIYYIYPPGWAGMSYYTQYRYPYWPFWMTGPAFPTEEQALDWVRWHKRTGGREMREVTE